MKRFIVFSLIAFVALTFASCGPKNKVEKLAPELAEDARVQFEKERYKEAIDIYTQLRDWYPFDTLAVEAEYNIAEAHFKMKEYDEASLAYVGFEKLHPSHESIDYIIHQQALCHFNRLDSEDRDQTHAIKALSILSRLTQQFPESDYTKEAEEEKAVCIKSIAAHEMYIGRFYLKSKNYKSAVYRFKTVLTTYPGRGFDTEAQDLLRRAEERAAEAASTE